MADARRVRGFQGGWHLLREPEGRRGRSFPGWHLLREPVGMRGGGFPGGRYVRHPWGRVRPRYEGRHLREVLRSEEERAEKLWGEEGYYKPYDEFNQELTDKHTRILSRHQRGKKRGIMKANRLQLKESLDSEMEKQNREKQLDQQRINSTRKAATDILPENQIASRIGTKMSEPSTSTNSSKSYASVLSLPEMAEKIRITDAEQGKLQDKDDKIDARIAVVKESFKATRIITETEVGVNASNHDKWIQKCKDVQTDLKKSLHFIQSIESCSEIFQQNHKFHRRLEECKLASEQQLQLESNENRLKNLSEYIRTNPNERLPVDIANWECNEIARHACEANIHAQFEDIVKKWSEKKKAAQ